MNGAASQAYPVELRRVVARVEVDGELQETVFLTNNLKWSAQTICDLYRCRWSIEVFFKELKRPSNWPTSSVRMPTPSAGRCGLPCRSICCWASARFSASGGMASHGS